MAYPVKHLQVRALGDFGGTTNEVIDSWSYGLRISIGTSDFTESKKEAFLQAVAPAFSAFHGALGTSAHPSAYLKKLTAAYIDTDGLYVGGSSQPTTEWPYVTPARGAGVAALPFSHAMAVTLRTDIDRGPGSQGRFYVPSGLAPSSLGSWNIAQATNARSDALDLINAVNIAARAQWIPTSTVSVITQTRQGFLGHVVEVSVGRAPDTQRRRDNRVAELHSFAPVTSASAFRSEIARREYV